MSASPILIVEDEPDGQLLVSRMLAVVGIAVEVAPDGETAWNMLETKDYKAAIVDLALPGMDGVELLRKIRSDTKLANLPCIAITAYHTPELKQQALAEGFDAYFAKPLDRTLFLGALDGVTEK
ncbi:MAG: response regulator [Anaerolineae bacterium]|nr:response regulator [Anaerolineae bacterium]